MPSAVYIHLETPTAEAAWEQFRRSAGLDDDPARPWEYRKGGLVVRVDGVARSASRDPATGMPPADPADRPDEFDRISVAGSSSRDDGTVASAAAAVLAAFPGTISCDPELDHLVTTLPRRPAWKDSGPPVPTDAEDAWLSSEGTSVTRVPAGRAVVRPAGDLLLLEIEGIPRASFRTLRDARIHAGRCTWTLWEGPTPDGADADP